MGYYSYMGIRAYLAFFSILLFHGCTLKDSSESNDNQRVYSWVELYADGHQDTVFSIDTLNYPQPIAWTAEKRQQENDTEDGVANTDTVYLNYGPHARDSLVEPRIQIENKKEILAAMDSVYRIQPMWPRANVKVTHFRGDSISTQVSDSVTMAFMLSPSPVICQATDSCLIGYTKECLNISYVDSVVFSYDFGVDPNRKDSAEIHWKFIIANRFGYKDSLEGKSVIVEPPSVCAISHVDQCQEMLVYKIQDTVYSWIEGYADGHRDTVFNADSSHWIGGSPITLENEYGNRSIMIVRPILAATFETVCPGDSLVVSASEATPMFYPRPDTVALNYGRDSVFPYQEPIVRFRNKDSLIVNASSAQFHNYPLYVSIWADHFRGDSAEVVLMRGTSHYVSWSTSDVGGCFVQNPCDSLKILTCVDVEYAWDYTTWPHLGITLDETTSGSFPWTLVVRNRFGYADTVSGVTRVSPFTCNH